MTARSLTVNRHTTATDAGRAAAASSGDRLGSAETADPVAVPRWPRPDLRYDADGLAPAIAQDAVDGRVLMVAYMDAEALEATLATGEVHFHSRSRGRLWRKGETSGHVMRLVDLKVDCDGDALLLTVEPVGPTCHRDTRSCFDPDGAPAERETQGFAWLETLWATIAARASERPDGSYTARLLADGVDAVARKVTEEATEVLIAARDDAWAEAVGTEGAGGIGDRDTTREALAGEAADLLYHVLVLLAERDLPASSVVQALRARHRH